MGLKNELNFNILVRDHRGAFRYFSGLYIREENAGNEIGGYFIWALGVICDCSYWESISGINSCLHPFRHSKYEEVYIDKKKEIFL